MAEKIEVPTVALTQVRMSRDTQELHRVGPWGAPELRINNNCI